MFPRRAGRTLGLLALLVMAGAGAGLQAGELSAEETLAKLGLKRTGIMLLLEAESEVHSKSDEIRQLARELSNTVMQQRGTFSQKDYQAALKELNVEIGQFRSELNAANRRISQLPRIRGRLMNNLVTEQMNELNMYKNQLQWEINQRTTFLNQLKLRPFDPKARGKLDTQVQEQREALQKAVVELRGLVDTTREKYAELAKDPAFKKALSAFGKEKGGTFKLGPSQKFHSDVKQLERLERLLSPEDGGGPTKGARTPRGSSKGKRTSTAK